MIANAAADFEQQPPAGIDGVLLPEPDRQPHNLSPPGATGKIFFDVDLARFPIDHPLVTDTPQAFALRRTGPAEGIVDPRAPGPAAGEALARLGDREVAEALLPALAARLEDLVGAGAAGFRIQKPAAADPDLLADLFGRLRDHSPDLLFIADTPGVPREAVPRLAGIGFDHVVTSLGYWDGRAPWFAEEHEALRTVAPPLAGIAPDAVRGSLADGERERLLLLAAGTGCGFIVPATLLAGGGAVPLVEILAKTAARFGGETRQVPLPASGATALIRGEAEDLRHAEEAMLLLINRSLVEAAAIDPSEILRSAGIALRGFEPLSDRLPPFAPLAPGEVRPILARCAKPVSRRGVGTAKDAGHAARRPRLVIETVTPQVDGGAFPAKRVVGEVVAVEADVFADGHEQLAAELRWRAADEKKWRAVRMTEAGNDVWRAAFPLERIGRYEFVVEAWLDRYGGFRRDFKKKRDAGVAQPVDFQEGRLIVEEAAGRSKGALAKRLGAFLSRIDGAGDADKAAALLLDPELALLMDEADARLFSIVSAPHPVESERLAARFSSWYELFPRSQTDDPSRHGTFADVIERLPQVRAMGFDTLYFPPIHPIGRSHRKGPNNSLEAGPDDPGSPYAIGSAEGGHDALHPQLGTLDDFRKLVEAARGHGLELALDFAIQCSPDHPWLKEHPGWFDWRPDGTIKYAENPPKKYQDIVNVDFWKEEAIPGLWMALRDVVLFWVEQGVRTFRVDNPHTKPFPFWEWMIGDIRAVHPDVIFLSEAFTRPKVMYRLAKIGYSQSYTYFTWRNSKAELTDYFTELATTEPREFFRPHLFVNTPDINPTFLHTSGRAGFRIRAALAATLSGLFGVYSGFELCESEPVPGKEEYWDSEKYIVKPRDWKAPGNIIADITLLNRLRRAFPALQTHLNTRFFNAWNDNILYYGKPSPDGADMILVAVSLDPHNAQEADFELPLWEFGLPDEATVEVEDLVSGARFDWHGKTQHLRLDPDQPYAIWRIAPGGAA